jgi:hypothetical protein
MKSMNPRRWIAGAVIAGATLTSLVLGQSAASAATVPSPAATTSDHRIGDQVCHGETNRYVICFSITQIGVSRGFNVHVGIDIYMSQQDAQNIIDAPGEEFSATLYGEDTIFDDKLKSIPVTWSASWEQGLSAEFDTFASRDLLDEDWDGDDELYATVNLYVPNTGSTRSFRTNTVVDRLEAW